MNSTQKYTPKYWVVHDPKTDDVMIDTLDKSRDGSLDKYVKQNRRPFDYRRPQENPMDDFFIGGLEVSLIEIKFTT